MPTILWNESSPDGGDSLGLGDNEIRSLKTSLRNGLDAEHVWPSGGGDAGVHRLGSARAYVGTQSLVSSSGTDGRLYWASDTSNVFHVGSAGTVFLGGPRGISHGSFPGGTPPQRYYWAEETGESNTGAATFPNSGYSGKPFVQLTAIDSGANGYFATINNVSKTGVAWDVFQHDGTNPSSVSVMWRSLGTRTL